MSDAGQQKVDTPVEEAPRECSRCGCQHMTWLSRQGRFGKVVMERFTCRHCGKVNAFVTKKIGAA